MLADSPRLTGEQADGRFGAEVQGCGSRATVSSGGLPHRWGIVLAGGDGVRLRHLTRFLYGDDRPKQFCPLLSERTLLYQTRRRAERSIESRHVLYSVTRAHQDYYVRDLADRAGQRIVQPSNKGTGPAILYPLLRILQKDLDAVVAILPCDHYYSSEQAFTIALESAFAAAEALPSSVVLLGAKPKAPDIEYGWIELGDSVPGHHRSVFHVNRFQEKPPLSTARRLFRNGALWNTFVMVGHVRAFLDLALASQPGLVETLRSACTSHPSGPLDVGRETRIPDWLYDQIAPTDFSSQVLSPGAARLVCMTLGNIEWNDLGNPERVITTLLERDGGLPHWATRWRVGHSGQRVPAQTSLSAAIR